MGTSIGLMLWLVCIVASTVLGARKNRTVAGFFLGFLLSILGLLIISLMPDKKAKLPPGNYPVGGYMPGHPPYPPYHPGAPDYSPPGSYQPGAPDYFPPRRMDMPAAGSRGPAGAPDYSPPGSYHPSASDYFDPEPPPYVPPRRMDMPAAGSRGPAGWPEREQAGD